MKLVTWLWIFEDLAYISYVSQTKHWPWIISWNAIGKNLTSLRTHVCWQSKNHSEFIKSIFSNYLLKALCHQNVLRNIAQKIKTLSQITEASVVAILVAFCFYVAIVSIGQIILAASSYEKLLGVSVYSICETVSRIVYSDWKSSFNKLFSTDESSWNHWAIEILLKSVVYSI